MAREPAPAFQFYVKDWRSSRHVQQMSFDERGRYLEMLIEQWEKGSLPASPGELARLIGGREAEWTRAWPKLSACFVTRKRDGRLVNAKLEAVRRDRERYRKAQAESGLRGAQRRWQQHGKPIGSPSKPVGSPMAKYSSSSSSSTAPSSSSSTADGTPPAAARSRRPIFSGQRLVVFEWQLDDLMRMLGPHTDHFDLHAWFSTLDARAVEAGCVIPQRDNGAWLQGETLAEARRRGLPIAITPPAVAAGKQTTRLAAAVARIATGSP